MTIQAMDITHLGIVMAADGAISMTEGEAQRRTPEHWRRRKLFRLDNIRGAIGYFGLAQIGNQILNKWLEMFLHQAAVITNAYDLAKRLADSLSKTITTNEAKHKLGFHLASYRQSPVGSVPEMHYIRNRESESLDSGMHFVATEEILGRHYKQLSEGELVKMLAEGCTIHFQNGYNQVYNAFAEGLQQGLGKGIWDNPEFTSKPESIREWGTVTEFRLRVVRLAFEKFYRKRGLHPVGGRLRFVAIPADFRQPTSEWVA